MGTEDGHLVQIGGATTAAASGGVDGTINDPWIRSFMWDPKHRLLKQNTVILADGRLKKKALPVFHSAIRLSAGKEEKTRIAVVGGGVQGFAFGQMYSDSFILELEWVYEPAHSIVNQHPSMASKKTRTQAAAPSTTRTATTLDDTEVFYVLKRDAKAVKDKLEAHELLNKQYRLSSADPTHCSSADAHVAVPVLSRAFDLWDSPDRPGWMTDLVQGRGRQTTLLSSSMFARHGKSTA